MTLVTCDQVKLPHPLIRDCKHPVVAVSTPAAISTPATSVAQDSTNSTASSSAPSVGSQGTAPTPSPWEESIKKGLVSRETVDRIMRQMRDQPGTKYDSGKARYDLLPVDALESLVAVYTYGAGKYADHNWRKGMSWSRVFGAAMRHLWAFWRGENNDFESGLPHLAHAAWCCFTLLSFMKTQPTYDDRIKEA